MPLATKRTQEDTPFSQIKTAYELFTLEFVTYLQLLLSFEFHSVFGQPWVK